MRLLVVTDHRFIRDGDEVFDTYTFDRDFFADYRAVFDEVAVAARMVYSPRPPGSSRSDGDGVVFVDLPTTSHARWMLEPSWPRFRGLRAEVERSDAVCVRMPSVAGRVGAAHAFHVGKPVMFEIIGDPALLFASWGPIGRFVGAREARSLRRIARRSVVGSYVSIRHLQRAYPAGPETETASISSIRLPESHVLPARHFESAPTPLRIVMVASMVRHKRHDTLLRAVADAVEHGADIACELVGDGPMREDVEALADELGIRRRCTFHGHVGSSATMRQIVDSADLFVLTSTSEGLPRALLECMARGLPAVGTDAPGTNEVLTPEQLVPIGDHVALGSLFAHLADDPRRLNELSRHSHETVRDFIQPLLSARRRKLLASLRREATLRAARDP